MGNSLKHIKTLLYTLSIVGLTSACMKPSGKKKTAGENSPENAAALPGETQTVSPVTPPPATPANPSPSATEPEQIPPTEGFSLAPSLNFKSYAVLTSDIATVLNLSPESMCNEEIMFPGSSAVTKVSCSEEVHLVALGGTEPYFKGIVEPVTQSANTTPIALERIVLTSCLTRAEADLSMYNGVIFRNLPLSSNQEITDINHASVNQAITELIKRAFLREPTADELGIFKEFYKELVAQKTAEPAKIWAQLSCYQALTSIEFILY